MKKKTKTRDVFYDLARVDRRKLDEMFHEAHSKVFEDFDCLSCAGCCKTIPPLVRDADIRRIALYLHMKPSVFTERYVTRDDEGDQVFKSTPCAFLLPDNKCQIYEHRPLACAEYPHTDRPRMYQVLELTRKNEKICPAIQQIMARIKSAMAG